MSNRDVAEGDLGPPLTITGEIMNIFGIILVSFPLAGQPGVMMSDKPQTPIEEPRGPDGQIVTPQYDGYTPPGKSAMQCWEETHMCYGSDGSMVPMTTRRSNNVRKETESPVTSPHKLYNKDNSF